MLDWQVTSVVFMNRFLSRRPGLGIMGNQVCQKSCHVSSASDVCFFSWCLWRRSWESGWFTTLKKSLERNFTACSHSLCLWDSAENKSLFWTFDLLTLRYQPSFHGVDLSALRGAAVDEYFRQPIVVSYSWHARGRASIHMLAFMTNVCGFDPQDGVSVILLVMSQLL